LWHGGVGGGGLGFTTGGTTTGGTTTGGVTVGGTTTGGTTTGGTTTGGTTTGGTTTGGTTTGGTTTVTVTSIVTGLGLTGLTGAVGLEEGNGVTVDVIPVTAPVDGGVTGLVTAGVGLTAGVATPDGDEVCCFGTTMSGLPPDWVGEPKLAPAAGGCEGGETAALEPITTTLTVATVVSPTSEMAATRVLTGVAASAAGRCNAAPSFTAATPPKHQAVSDRPADRPFGRSAVAPDNYSIRTVPTKSLSVATMAERPSDIASYRHKSAKPKAGTHKHRGGTGTVLTSRPRA
jgi:hypothetical protein